ncbi:ABC transporter permease [Pseudorhodoplanes sinuspersici]|uniref:ABC transporter permease n=1 Tax=Pseudorhodoplanes sinuspersici TaxID=1235591 RepID=A0A1W6ZUJ8_9HYPH|nr:ABC transporter permease [Pseudorhodoplanes sinuspersici]ARQ01000.1 ABC transporter permease [Pseudorhodoplanes sinuspersici]RKE72637.1 putative ABC transport system permease protein [Pseudorhodoplanes sinuspersici]
MISVFINLIPVTLVQSLIYSFVALAIMIPFRTLSLPDLTMEGSFPLGGCLVAAVLTVGLDPWSSTALAIVAGFLAGAATALVHLYFKIHSLLAGILVATMIWSVDLRVMGMPNKSVRPELSVFDAISPEILLNIWLQIAIFGALVALIVLVLIAFYKSEIGLSLRCVGANARLSPALGINARIYVVLGFGIANALAALGGAIVVQQQGYADVTMGFGILVNGLAALIIGEAIIGRATIDRQIIAPVVGSIIYYQLVSLGLATGLHPSDLKFLTGAFVLITLGLPLLTGRSRSVVGA